MIDHAFKKVKLHRLEAEILPHNKISIKLSKKLGMSYEGIRKKCLYINGEWKDHKVYAITAEDRGIFNMKPNKRFL
jgi:ribosomal-protein-alanine N-acetyltransferase